MHRAQYLSLRLHSQPNCMNVCMGEKNAIKLIKCNACRGLLMEGSSGAMDLRQIRSLNSCHIFKVVKAFHSLVKKDVGELCNSSKD